ncbi:MAG: DUF3332 domain-containing protein [Prevotella sp.]|nr:DUF3332 domain-containing protein [Prevotella sp.]
MKKINVKVAAWLLLGCMATSSCIGSFSLFNKLTSWETHMTDSKFVNAIVGFVINIVAIPVTLLVDSLVLNTIEFWSGDNPIEANVGKTKQVMGEDGRYYAVKTLKNGYEVTAPDGVVTNFFHNADNDSWSMEQNGVVKEIFRFNTDGTRRTIQAEVNGQTKEFTLNEAGVYEARMAAGDGVFFAMN